MPTAAPSPPRRQSSRNNSTLRLISDMKISAGKTPRVKRHETCFISSSPAGTSNIKYLRDRISCKLGSPPAKKNTAIVNDAKSRMQVSKSLTVTPVVRANITSTLRANPETRSAPNRSQNKGLPGRVDKSTDVCCSRRSLSTSPIRKVCKTCLQRNNAAKTKLADRTKSLERTFGLEKRKLELSLPKAPPFLRSQTSELTSPREVQKAAQGAIKKTTSALLSSVRNGIQSTSADIKSLPVTVTYSEQGKQLLQGLSRPEKPTSSQSEPSTSRRTLAMKRNVSPSISEKSRSSSQLSINSKPSPKKKIANFKTDNPPSQKTVEKTLADRSAALEKKLKKAKKEQLNGEIAKKDKKNGKSKENKTKDKTLKKCAGRAAGTEIAKKLKDMNKNIIRDGVDNIPIITLDDIKHKRDEVQSDSFFQHLLLRDISSPTPSLSSRSSWLSERTKMLNRNYMNRSYSQPTAGALQVYLSHTRPVSDSKFRSLDRELIRSRSASPKSVTWQMEDELREPIYRPKDQPAHERSSSLPPKIVFSETSRPISPAAYHKTIRSSEPSSIVVSPSSRRIVGSRSSVRSIEGIHGLRRTVRTRSAGDAEKYDRSTRSLGTQSPTLTQSTSSLNLSQITDPQEYQSYVNELIHSSKKSERFKELNDFYTSLERLGQLELTTLSTNSRPRRKFEDEIIDYDRWKEVRTRERAERELTSLYMKLKNDQREKGLLFRPKDVDSYRWRKDYDRGLRVKEKSVENIKVHFEQLKDKESELEASKRREIEYGKDHYKPLWRGSSVANLATSMVEKRAHSEGRAATISRYRKLDPETERLLTKGIGSRLWSSLSMEQVNALKNQLTEIYGNAPGKPMERPVNDYSINVSSVDRPNSSLTVRRNSTNDFHVSDKPEILTLTSPNITKSSSISSLSNSKHTLSESDKKRLSMTLSQEVLERVSSTKKYKTALSLVLAKETRGAVAAADANIKQQFPPQAPESISSPRTCSLEVSEDDTQFRQVKNGDYLLVIPNESKNGVGNNETSEADSGEKGYNRQQSSPSSINRKVSSTSETESTDESTKTVIFMGNKKQVQEKVEYFEQTAEPYTPIVHRPAEILNEIGDTLTISPKENGRNVQSSREKLSSSQSFTSLKDLFGEQDILKFASLPLSATRKVTYVTPTKPRLRTESTPIEYVYRSRSLSPDEIKYARSNGTQLKHGKVRKLKTKFEYVEDFYSNRLACKPRRYHSNPELFSKRKSQIFIPGQEAGDVDWLRKRYEYPSIARRGRSRTRRGGVVSPAFLRAEDRFMPHIDIISKIASLYTSKQTSPSKEAYKSPEEASESLGCPKGEVKKLREKFDSPERDISLLGHMFTSSPNVHELRDIAPYLAAQWTAHRYPSVEDNTRSLSSPEHATSKDLAMLRRDRSRPKSTSPPRPRKKPPSILKTPPHQCLQSRDIFANQYFDPSIHRPISRYRPPASPESVRYRTWWPPFTACSARPTVTFKGAVF